MLSFKRKTWPQVQKPNKKIKLKPNQQSCRNNKAKCATKDETQNNKENIVDNILIGKHHNFINKRRLK